MTSRKQVEAAIDRNYHALQDASAAIWEAAEVLQDGETTAVMHGVEELEAASLQIGEAARALMAVRALLRDNPAS